MTNVVEKLSLRMMAKGMVHRERSARKFKGLGQVGFFFFLFFFFFGWVGFFLRNRLNCGIQLAQLVKWLYKINKVQSSSIPKIDWCLDLMIKNYHQERMP